MSTQWNTIYGSVHWIYSIQGCIRFLCSGTSLGMLGLKSLSYTSVKGVKPTGASNLAKGANFFHLFMIMDLLGMKLPSFFFTIECSSGNQALTGHIGAKIKCPWNMCNCRGRNVYSRWWAQPYSSPEHPDIWQWFYLAMAKRSTYSPATERVVCGDYLSSIFLMMCKTLTSPAGYRFWPSRWDENVFLFVVFLGFSHMLITHFWNFLNFNKLKGTTVPWLRWTILASSPSAYCVQEGWTCHRQLAPWWKHIGAHLPNMARIRTKPPSFFWARWWVGALFGATG